MTKVSGTAAGPRPYADEICIPVGLGTFPFSGVFGRITHEKAAAVVEAFAAAGGRYIETAASYPRIGVDIGRLLKLRPRAHWFLAIKCVTTVDAQGTTVRSGKEGYLRAELAKELERLDTTHVDLLQAHNAPDDTSMEELAAALVALRGEGLTRYIGLSNISLEQLQAFTRFATPDFVQNRWSLLHREASESLVPFCVEHGIASNPFQVIERGQLTEQPSRERGWAAADLRDRKPEYGGVAYDLVRTWVVSELGPIAHAHGLSVEDLAIGWLLSRPTVAVAVLGARSPAQVHALCQQREALAPALVKEIDARVQTLESRIRHEHGMTIDEFRGIPLPGR